jgi:hypothetical protein
VHKIQTFHGHAKWVVAILLQYSAFGIKGYAGVAQVVFYKILVIVGDVINYNAAIGGEDVPKRVVFVNKIADVVGGLTAGEPSFTLQAWNR